jgi:hypothetical protein
MKNRTAKTTTVNPNTQGNNKKVIAGSPRPVSKMEKFTGPPKGVMDGGMSGTSSSRPTVSGGRVLKFNSINRDENTMTSNKVRLDKSGNVISDQVTDYNKIPFKNKAIDLINRIDYKMGNAINRGGDKIMSAPSVMREDLRAAANRAGKMLTKENYNKGEVTSEFDGNVVSGLSKTRPTMSGGMQEKVKYDMPGGGKRIEKKRYNEEGYITDRKIKDKKINPR